jgi:Asp-tRNA(Asn)/Glu-tRNA(Gln) amidotransferase A subunit family amidase
MPVPPRTATNIRHDHYVNDAVGQPATIFLRARNRHQDYTPIPIRDQEFVVTVPFPVEEATIGQIHQAYLAGRTSARAVVQAHLDRIAAYDQRGPALAAIVVVNPAALDEADALDREFAATGVLSGKLHGIPVLIKDNYDVAGLQTTGGSATLLGWFPAVDATIVGKIRAAGGIVIAKTTMSEWARGGLDNINSVLPGFARNPYNTAYATGGSSGGTGSGLAASFGVVGLGSDTLGSIRNPSSNNALAGLRPSWALASRAGMLGLYDARDTAGPMARTVEDMAILLDVIAGVDPADPATAGAGGKIPPSYTDFLQTDAARGRRLGVLRQAFPTDASDPQVLALFDAALEDLRDAGVEIVDPFEMPDFAKFPPQAHPLSEVRAAIERYLAGTGDHFPKTLADVFGTGKFHPLHELSLLETSKAPAPSEDPLAIAQKANEAEMRVAYLRAMDAAGIDALLMPVASFPPKLNGDRNTTPTGSTTAFASALCWPAAVVPMGTSYENLPSGLQIVGRPWSDPLLISLAYAYEQATKHRRPPPLAAADINLPEIVAEVTRAFHAYNEALVAADSARLNGFFWSSSNTVRFGPGENLFGHDEIAAYRSTRWAPNPPRTLERLAVTTIGRDFGTTNAVFRRTIDGGLSRQSQTWSRQPEGWRIIAAHVSSM